MKMVTRYEIRKIEGNENSKPVNYTQRLRDRKRALKLVRKLKSCGMDVFASPLKVCVK